MRITQEIGDRVVHRIPLRWKKSAFYPTDNWFLIFTCKADNDDADANAKFQKTTGFGIAVSGKYALVEVLPANTSGDADADPAVPALSAGTYYCDIQAQSLSDPSDIRTVWEDELVLTRDVTRGTETAVPVYVAEPPLRYDTQLVTYQ